MTDKAREGQGVLGGVMKIAVHSLALIFPLDVSEPSVERAAQIQKSDPEAHRATMRGERQARRNSRRRPNPRPSRNLHRPPQPPLRHHRVSSLRPFIKSMRKGND